MLGMYFSGLVVGEVVASGLGFAAEFLIEGLTLVKEYGVVLGGRQAA